MKLKFDSTLEYQQDAINAVVELFGGQPKAEENFAITYQSSGSLVYSDLGIANKLTISKEQLLENVQKIQTANSIEKIKNLQDSQYLKFSIEMETGTGKTYVYLRTIFELSKHYGLKKFVIVVPSIAVREGVIQSIKAMREHFYSLYDNEPFSYFLYDSKNLDPVRQFATNNRVQIMIINIQSFQRDVETRKLSELTPKELKNLNVINRENDRMSGRKPIEFIRDTNPIVIIDEPQSVDNTDKAKKAVENLNPLITLRYSATHRDYHNLLYKLDPVRAYELNLVKRIEVASVYSDDFNNSYIRLLAIDNKKGIKAKIEIYQKTGNAVRTRKLWVKQGDNLYEKSNEHEQYRNGYIVENINCRPGDEYIGFNGGKDIELGRAIGGSDDDIMRAQIYDTVEQHLDKERLLRAKKIKVLSLFFIDKVANYRVYNEDGTVSPGKICKWFEDAYRQLTEKPRHKEFAVEDITKIHDGYFSQDRRKRYKDSTERGSADDNGAYEKIMRDKEQLLDPQEPLRFIFSHSALREGWDNPNVFQICTLNQSASEMKKRQEIGRGLRLPVNAQGERVHDENINRLTVIVNESYENFANSLQRELEEDLGVKFGRIEETAFAEIIRKQADGKEEPIGLEQSKRIREALRQRGYIDNDGRILKSMAEIKSPLDVGEEFRDIDKDIVKIMKQYRAKMLVSNARERRKIWLNKEVLLNPEFKALWDKIKYKTRYRVNFKTSELVDCAVKRIKELKEIEKPKIIRTLVATEITQEGVSVTETGSKYYAASPAAKLPDILAYLQKETELTRDTLVKILKNSGRLKEFVVNPQQFMMLVAREINRALYDLMIDGIRYEKIKGDYWEMNRIEGEAEEGIIRYLHNLYEVQNEKKCPFDAIVYESDVEEQFARDLDNHSDVRMFLKLPGWFKIDTPIGAYNPDWAFVSEYDEKLYFVCETKSSTDKEDLRKKETQKITCGESHFQEIGVNYKTVTKLSEIDSRRRSTDKNDNT